MISSFFFENRNDFVCSSRSGKRQRRKQNDYGLSPAQAQCFATVAGQPHFTKRAAGSMLIKTLSPAHTPYRASLHPLYKASRGLHADRGTVSPAYGLRCKIFGRISASLQARWIAGSWPVEAMRMGFTLLWTWAVQVQEATLWLSSSSHRTPAKHQLNCDGVTCPFPLAGDVVGGRFRRRIDWSQVATHIRLSR